MKTIALYALLGSSMALSMDLNEMVNESEEALMQYSEDVDAPLDTMLV